MKVCFNYGSGSDSHVIRGVLHVLCDPLDTEGLAADPQEQETTCKMRLGTPNEDGYYKSNKCRVDFSDRLQIGWS